MNGKSEEEEEEEEDGRGSSPILRLATGTPQRGGSRSFAGALFASQVWV